MTTRSPSAYFLSAFLHTFVIVGMVLFALLLRPEEKESPHIFELVAGEGNNFAATEAPALGTQDGIMVEMPVVPAPTPRPAPPEPVVAPTPVWVRVTLLNRLMRMCRSNMRMLSGRGSNENTRPDGPMVWADTAE